MRHGLSGIASIGKLGPTRNYCIPADGPCSCHVGKARFALEIQNMSGADNLRLVAAEIHPLEISGPGENYDAAYHRALVKHVKNGH